MKTLLSRLDLSYIYAFLSEATLGLTFIFYILLARSLGPDQYGIFTAANALAATLSVFILFGLPTLLAREVAANPGEGLKSTTTFLVIQGLNSLITFILLAPIAQWLDFEGTNFIVCYLVVLSGACRAFKQTLRAVFQGLGQFRSETISVAIERSSVVLLSGIVLVLTKSLVWVVATIALIRTLDVFILLYFLKLKVPVSIPLSFYQIRKSFQMAYPFALSGVLWILYYQVDILMLKLLSSAEETGLYGAAYGLIEIFNALPRVIFYVALNRFSRCHAENADKLSQEVRKSTLLLLLIVLPFIAISGFFQVSLLNITYGKAFLTAANTLSLLLPSLSFKMFSALIETILIATRNEKSWIAFLLASVIFNMGVNAILIPQLGSNGAALSTLFTEIVYATLGVYLLGKLGYKSLRRNLGLLAFISLVIAGMPSLIVHGFNPVIGAVLIIISIVVIALLMHPRQFLKRVL